MVVVAHYCRTIFLLLLLDILTITRKGVTAASTMCFVCDSRTLESCGDPFRQSAEINHKECKSGWCQKLRSVELVDGKDVYIVRTCNEHPANQERCFEETMDVPLKSGTKRLPFEMCQCKGDMCNSAPRHPSSVWTVALLIPVVVGLRVAG